MAPHLHCGTSPCGIRSQQPARGPRRGRMAQAGMGRGHSSPLRCAALAPTQHLSRNDRACPLHRLSARGCLRCRSRHEEPRCLGLLLWLFRFRRRDSRSHLRAQRIAPEEARSLPKIPALPLSWRDAKPLLENMNGPEAPQDWQGALPIRYRFTGAVKVHVKVDMDTSMQAYTVVEARIRGSEVPDEWVLLGNHRDAWVF